MNHPIARFVAVVALVAIAWSGAGAPAVAAPATSTATLDHGRTGYLTAELANTGHLPVTIRSVTWTSDGLAGGRLLLSPDTTVHHLGPMRPFRLDAGERRLVMLVGRIHCPFPGPVVTVDTDPLRVEADPVAGPARTVSVTTPDVETTLPCPAGR